MFAEFLLNAGAKLNAVNNTNETPLHCACRRGSSVGIVDLLLDNGADVHAQDSSGREPFHLAWHAAVIRRLLEAGVDANVQTSDGRNALLTYWPQTYENLLTIVVEALRTLLNAGINRYLVHPSGETPVLRLAMMADRTINSDSDRMQYLLHFTAFLRSQDVPINPPQHTDVKFDVFAERQFAFGYTDVLRVMLIAGADFLPIHIDNRDRWVDRMDSPSAIAKFGAIHVHSPEKLVWTRCKALKDTLNNRIKVEQERKENERLKKQYHNILWQYCLARVLELAMIFVEFPALIIVEICLFDRDCLRDVEERLLWDVVKKVKKKNANKM